MSSTPELVVQHTADQLAIDVAARTVATLSHVLMGRERAALCLTAGGIMERVWRALAESEAAEALDWSRVDVFFADERYVASDSADRNDAAARRVLFDHSPFKAVGWYPMPAADGEAADLDRAASTYARTLSGARRGDDPDEIPNFDVLLLGIGPDGHCASLFPEHPSAHDDSGPVIAVRNSPKPPPNRLSLSFEGLAAANEIWFVVAGAEKAEAVALAWSGAGRIQVPAAGPRGRLRTLWLIDHAAAGKLPKHRYEPPIL
jgi:6-phosphogluconolactonase